MIILLLSFESLESPLFISFQASCVGWMSEPLQSRKPIVRMLPFNLKTVPIINMCEGRDPRERE